MSEPAIKAEAVATVQSIRTRCGLRAIWAGGHRSADDGRRRYEDSPMSDTIRDILNPLVPLGGLDDPQYLEAYRRCENALANRAATVPHEDAIAHLLWCEMQHLTPAERASPYWIDCWEHESDPKREIGDQGYWPRNAARAVLALFDGCSPANQPAPVVNETRHPWPRKGDRMRFLGKNGYEHELAEAMKLFVVGHEYEVINCQVGDWHHTVAFVGKPGRHNGVMFERALPSGQREGDNG